MSDFIPGFGTEARQEQYTPKQVKGGVFAPADINLIKAALSMYADQDISEAEQRQIANLIHRLSSRV